MRKPKTGQVRIPSPFDTTASKTERSAVAILMHWMRQIIERENLDLGLPDVDTSGADRKSPDTVIYESRRSQNVLCVIEAKPPYYDVFDNAELIKPAWEKANKRRSPYFATTNFQELIWFSTQKVNAQRPLEEQVVDKYHLSELEDLNLIEEATYKESITRALEKFLTKLYAVYNGKEPEPKQAIDEFLIYRLHDKVRRLTRYYAPLIEDQCHKDKAFSSKLSKWFNDQGWSFGWSPQDFDKAARQTAYLLVNKILFYNLLQAKRPGELAPLEIPQGLIKGAQLRKILQSFFDEIIINIDYKTIYTTDFIDTIAFPDQKEVVGEVKELVSILQEYDFSKLGYEIIGGIFQKLIPQEERHNLGQYFTNPDVVDLILCFCEVKPQSKVFDPACGAGTFLVRAYQHKKLMNQYLKHEDILETLWGNDIAKFPAHLTTINLAINDLSVDRNYPNIMQEDFFDLLTTEKGFELPPRWRKARARTLAGEREIEYPRYFNCVVGNPPYTRQEEIAEIAPEDRQYKGKLIDKALKDINGRQIADIPRRAGIYVYFFVHGVKFLRNGGRFGFVVSESWLDVDYGKGLQEFLLKNYKIIAIIGSKVERWFEDADINTCIVILEKCSGDDHRKERDENLVRFVYLKKPLRYFVPPAQDIWEKQVTRINAIKDKFIKTILAHNDPYDGDDFRIFPKPQKELWEESYDAERKKYVGSKWGKYFRAPDIFFKILDKYRGKFVPLNQIAEVKFGIKTGARKFFYLTEKQIQSLRLEQECWTHKSKGAIVPNYIVTSIKDNKCIEVQADKLRYRILIINKDKRQLKGTNILSYIKRGEEQDFNKRPTCKSRDRWYSLGKVIKAQILSPYAAGDRMVILLNETGVFANDNLVHISPYKVNPVILCTLLNSTIFLLMSYVSGVELTGSVNVVKLNPSYTGRVFTVNPENLAHPIETKILRAFEKIKTLPIGNILDEIRVTISGEVILAEARKAIDEIVMNDILGLTDEEQLEVYRAVIDLVKSRLGKAKSFGKRKKTKEGIDIDLMVKLAMEKVGEDILGKFYAEKVLSQSPLETKTLPPAGSDISIRKALIGWRLYSDKQSIDCASEAEARYLKVWLDAGLDSVKVPQDEDHLEVIVRELESLKRKIDDIIAPYLDSIINVKTKDRISRQLWMEITRGVRGE